MQAKSAEVATSTLFVFYLDLASTVCYYDLGTAVRGRRFDPLTEGNFFCPLI